MKYLILVAMMVLGTACVVQSATQTSSSTQTATPTVVAALAMVGAATGTPTIARTAIPTVIQTDIVGSYDDPHDFPSFAARLDQAMRTADIQFFLDNVAFDDLKCEVDFPAESKYCSGRPRGATVRGIVAGVWASEGFGLDAEGYEAFMQEFLTNTDVSAFDAYGDPRPRLYAYGIFKPEHRGSDVTDETVQAFATRVTSGSGSKLFGRGRSVLILHVGFDGKHWRIAKLTVTPPIQQYPPAVALLDPSRPETKEMLEYWRRWEPSPGPLPTRAAPLVSKTAAEPPATTEKAVVTPETGQWKLFSSREHGFEFRYPESCGVPTLNDSLSVGGRIELTILESEGSSLSDYVNRFADNRAKNGDWKIESIRSGVLGGQEAMTSEYRFGGGKRFGTATFTLRNGKVYVWGLTAGGFTCDEPNVYGPLLSSFRFTR